ncbi:DHA1 family L-arabinose/isopropyl-beta-D-thiogalactopyranoside export protein-like MFS transporter/DHA1 family inner membrane transport protein [Actinoplanes tereljensis]|uniref:MFS transporter n=1 Tax=Paractinoplanes tereljensis TaxID=571912 RepID=A0A919NMD0_9ACTN|nr:MFS transporter [Actinoplanes tereljensis]GIF20247.1 MFS transporter [Actinoplanes tereljensis]
MTMRRAWAALVVLSLAAFAFVTTELLPIGLLAVMAPDLDRSRSQVGLLVSGYAVVVVLASIPLTLLTQRVPRRQLLTVTMVLFAAANLAGALAPTYEMLAGARLITALTQALFWSVSAPAVTGLFPVGKRGRVVALFGVGPALAPVLGVPICTWLGQQTGWRSAFVLMAAFGVVTAVAVAALLPSYRPEAGGAARGTAPDRRKFRIIVLVTAVGITGFLTFYTYVTPFLLDVSGFGDAALAPLLFVAGAAGTLGTVAVSRTLDRHPVGSMLVPLAIGAIALLGLAALGGLRPVTVVLLAGQGLAYAAFATALQNRMLQVAPGSTDLASATLGSAFNIGIAAGSLAGGALLSAHGPRPLALTGGLLVVAAVALLAADRRSTVSECNKPANQIH